MNIHETNDIKTAVFQHYACNALENNALAIGGGKNRRLKASVSQPETFFSNQSTPCLPAWGVVVCAGAAYVAPAACPYAPTGGSVYCLTNKTKLLWQLSIFLSRILPLQTRLSRASPQPPEISSVLVKISSVLVEISSVLVPRLVRY